MVGGILHTPNGALVFYLYPTRPYIPLSRAWFTQRTRLESDTTSPLGKNASCGIVLCVRNRSAPIFILTTHHIRVIHVLFTRVPLPPPP